MARRCEAGWSWTGQPCPAGTGGATGAGGASGTGGSTGPSCECCGTGPGGVPVTVACGESACGSNYYIYACSEAGWSATGQPCTAGPCLDSSQLTLLPEQAGLGFSRVGDFNQDGKPDLLGVAGTTVQVALGAGDGTFPSVKSTSGYSVSGPRGVADLNGDTRLDFATVAYQGSGADMIVSLFAGNGDGTFSGPTNVAMTSNLEASGCGTNPSGLAIVDLNGDQKLDLVTSNAQTASKLNGITVFLGNGDHKPDIITSNTSGVSVLLRSN